MACADLSLSSAFDILGAAGEGKLLHLKHKLKTLRPGCRGADLLHAMVLLKLGQETEARISLEALKADAVARLVARQWAGMDSAEVPEEPPDLSWAVARVYHLLAEEKLCPATMRDMAYQAALHTFSSRDDHRLAELQGEAQDRCGWGIIGDPESFQPLHSDLGCLPPSSVSPSGTRSLPQPIEHLSGWSRGRSLRSTGSPASLASNLEISQSPTMPFLSHHRSCHGPSKLCDEPQASLVPEPAPPGCQEPQEVSWPPSVETVSPPSAETANPPQGETVSPPSAETANPPQGETVSPSSGETASPPSGETASPPLEETASPSPGETTSSRMPPNSAAPRLTELVPDASSAGQPDPPRALEISTHYPVECTDALAAPKSLSLPSRNTWPDKGQSPLPLPVEDTASQVASASPPPPSPPRTSPPRPSPATLPSTGLASSSLCPPSPELESEQKFYNFVILHVAADEHIALRVRERLEALGVPDGATFCEDFQVPGRGELHCLQDAIDHSAFTILLLTPNFDCRLGLHQASQSLMNSLTRPGRQDCVIPFLPLESSQAPLSPHTTSLLTGLVWLDERSQIFARRVANTFKAQRLRARKANWKKEQDVRALQEQRRHLEGERQQVAALNAAYSAYFQSCLSWQAQMETLRMAFDSHMPFGTQMPPGSPSPPFPSWPGHQPPPAPPWLAGSPAPTYPPPPTFPPPPAFPQAAPAPPQSPGLQPLIIHHAQMVQLGLNNHMWNQRGAQAPEDKTQGAE
ncbi:TIR domain-containing adapter molecule 1 [Ursus maritimus]|uniref:TIR domain-containing adapter molecule 1 n=1 Tax=Ursus maritimus TaxID=29073 RepID=A0A8M1FQ22_URSMA|nr:TIR domain-containing adapter molecule 1 [Ursus maritimus]XP_040485472.1 TIR domain-containing adapter molecule 1 [Ursus maritimus]XP_040485473.1 TIR domain-containing adapter molecule 1 [Ursus maritimus]